MKHIKIRKLDLIFLVIIASLLLIIGSIYLFNNYQAHQAEVTSQRELANSIAESQSLVQESQIAESQAIAQTHAMRPESNLTQDQINDLDNTDLEFWFTPAEPYSKEPSSPTTDIENLMDDDSIIWLGEDNQNVYLTMDLGYEYNDNVTKILDIAKEYNVKINFFLTGEFLESEPEKVKRMVNEGHMVGNHTYSHYRAPELIADSVDLYKEELSSLEADFTALTGAKMAPYIRPPYGAFSERTLAMNKQLGYYTVFWSFAYLDWDTQNQPDPETTLDLVLSQLHNGEVFLLHTISDTNVAILPDLFKEAQAQGYQFKRLDERFLN